MPSISERLQLTLTTASSLCCNWTNLQTPLCGSRYKGQQTYYPDILLAEWFLLVIRKVSGVFFTWDLLLLINLIRTSKVKTLYKLRTRKLWSPSQVTVYHTKQNYRPKLSTPNKKCHWALPMGSKFQPGKRRFPRWMSTLRRWKRKTMLYDNQSEKSIELNFTGIVSKQDRWRGNI